MNAPRPDSIDPNARRLYSVVQEGIGQVFASDDLGRALAAVKRRGWGASLSRSRK